MKYMLLIFTGFASIGSSQPLSTIEPEVLEEIGKAEMRFSDSENITILNHYFHALSVKRPRIYELQRRIEIPDDCFGEISNNAAELLYEQIDSYIFKNPKDFKDGLVAMRIVAYDKNSASYMATWLQERDGSVVSKTTWNRDYPKNTIDFVAPLNTWTVKSENISNNVNIIDAYNQYFADPMPVTIIRKDLKQVSYPKSIIMEKIIKSSGSLKYYWAVRSELFTPKFNELLHLIYK